MHQGAQMYECFHCLHRAVLWGADFDYADYGLEGQGIIHECECMNCGAQITYYCPIKESDEDPVEVE